MHLIVSLVTVPAVAAAGVSALHYIVTLPVILCSFWIELITMGCEGLIHSV